MTNIITYLIAYNQYLLGIISYLTNFIVKFIPLKQLIHEDSCSPKYQKFKIDKLPIILKFEKQDYRFLIEYYIWKYGKNIKPINRRNGKSISEDITCPRCGATHHYIYDNNGGKGEYLCKVCNQTFQSGTYVTKSLNLTCPYCKSALVPKKDRSCFTVHKCVNKKCSYYTSNVKKLPKDLPKKERYKYKLHYIYREFNIDFFKIDLNSVPKNCTSLKFKKNNAHIMGLCLTYHVNLGLSLRKTALALRQIHGINISHTMVANYSQTAAMVIKPFVDNYNYEKSSTFIADETYIKVRKVKGYLWLIMDAVSRSILGYQVSDNRGVGACILAMRKAFNKITKLPDNFKFIADGYSAYTLAAQQFALNEDNPLKFDITQVIGLANNDAVSKEYRPYKQIVERLNRTYKETYRVTCGYDNFDGANYSVALWVCYYNFLREHKTIGYKTLNKIDALDNVEKMQDKWQILIYLGQKTILKMQ